MKYIKIFEKFEEELLLEKYEDIDFTPPQDVADSAAYGLELRKKASKSNKGGLTNKQASEYGIGSGVQRAVNLKNKDKISPKVIKQMVAFFSRHEKNAKIDAGKEAHEDRGKIAWELWGGNAGRRWANKILNQMKNFDEKNEK